MVVDNGKVLQTNTLNTYRQCAVGIKKSSSHLDFQSVQSFMTLRQHQGN